jgi:hypothetical protein
VRKNGKTAVFADICLIETPNDQFGNDYVVIQSISKEERAAGMKGATLGNGKIRGAAAQRPATAPQTTTTHVPGGGTEDKDDLQF